MAKKRSITSLSVSLVARTKKFIKKIKRAIRQVKKFSVSIKALSVRVGKMGLAFSAVALGGLALFVKKSFASLDALAKMSDVLGISASKLRGFQRAAELTGVTTEGMNKAFIQLSKNIAEAATGTGEALDAFKALRLDVTKLVKLKPDEAMFAFAKALESIPGDIQRIGILSDVLGARQVRLSNLFAMGADNLREMVGEADRLFGTLTRFDLFKIETANDLFADMLRSLRGLGDAVAVVFAAPVGVVADKLTNFFVNLREGIPGAIASIKGGVIRLLDAIEILVRRLFISMTGHLAAFVNAISRVLQSLPLLPVLATLREFIEPLENSAGSLLASAERQRGTLQAKLNLRGRTGADLEGASKALGTKPLVGTLLSGLIGNFLPNLRKTFAAMQEQMKARRARAAEDQAGNLRGEAAVARAEERFVERRVRTARILSEGAAIFEKTRTPLERFTKAMAKLKDLFTKNLLPGGLKTFNLEAKRLQGILGGATKGVSRAPLTAVQIDPSLMFIPGLSRRGKREQIVRDPQLVRVIELLIEANRQGPSSALTV